MLISEEKKVIFVHIQKTAGESISEVLKSSIPDIQPLLNKHDFAQEGLRHLGKKKWDSYFKFAVVRNPWDRMVSWYSMISNNKPVHKLWKYVQDNSNNFDEFIIKCTDTITDDDGIESFLFNQFDYISDEAGNLIVDKVITFENLSSEMNKIFKQLNLKKVSLPKIKHNSNRGSHKGYYTMGTAEIVNCRFRKDIDFFNYSY